MSNRTDPAEKGAFAEHHALKTTRERLREFGITLEVEPTEHPRSTERGDASADAIVTLVRADAKVRYALVVKEPMTLSSVAYRRSATPYPLLVVGDRISRRSAAALRDAGIQFVDALGNAFIAFGDTLVEVQGRTEQPHQATKSSPRSVPPHQSTNLFSPGRAQVVLALLAWPELACGSVREIATAAGMSVGQAHDALTRLEQAGFLMPTSRRLTRTDELLDYWTAGYPAGLGRRLRVAQYHGDPARPVSSEQPVYLSSESAVGVDIARPATLTVYLGNPDTNLPILNRWSASPDRVPNIFVRHKFWISPRPHEEDPAMKTQNAPWPLVYADLAATGDARLGEVAQTWRERSARSEEM